MRVVALTRCYDNVQVREEGEHFDVEEKNFNSASMEELVTEAAVVERPVSSSKGKKAKNDDVL
jgi:hypothetical protein